MLQQNRSAVSMQTPLRCRGAHGEKPSYLAGVASTCQLNSSLELGGSGTGLLGGDLALVFTSSLPWARSQPVSLSFLLCEMGMTTAPTS